MCRPSTMSWSKSLTDVQKTGDITLRESVATHGRVAPQAGRHTGRFPWCILGTAQEAVTNRSVIGGRQDRRNSYRERLAERGP